MLKFKKVKAMIFLCPPGLQMTESSKEDAVNFAKSHSLFKLSSPIMIVEGSNLNNPEFLKAELNVGDIICLPSTKEKKFVQLNIKKYLRIKRMLTKNNEKSSYSILSEYCDS